MSDKDEQDWIDLLAGQSMPNADPKTVRDAQIFRGSLLTEANRFQDDADIPYPHLLKNILSNLTNPPQPSLTKKPPTELPTPVLNVSRINLNQWLQDNFVEAINRGWLALEEILAPTIPAVAFRGTPTNRIKGQKRAKPIQLGEEHTVVFVIELEEQDNQEIRILMRLSPIRTQIHLPENIKFKVIPELGEPLEEIAGTHHDYLEQEWFYEPGESFRTVVALNEMSVTEDFDIPKH